MALILFLIPTRSKDATTATIMGPEVIKNIPWNIVILFGGGFALAKGFQVTGLSTLIGGMNSRGWPVCIPSSSFFLSA